MDEKVSGLDPIPSVDRATDLLYIVDTSGGSSNRVTPNTLLGISGSPVGTTDTQTLTNKTITSPTVSSPTLSGTISGTYTFGGTPTFPSSVVTLTGTQTLTNKTLTSPTINTPTISNASITADSVSGHTSANTGSVYGVGITSGVITGANSVSGGALTANSINASVVLQDNSVPFGKLEGSAWTSYTPTITAGGGTPATVSAQTYYTSIGKTVIYNGEVTITSRGTATTGMFIPLPVTAKRVNSGTAIGREFAVTGNAMTGAMDTVNRLYMTLYGNGTPWVDGYKVQFSVTYEAA